MEAAPTTVGVRTLCSHVPVSMVCTLTEEPRACVAAAGYTTARPCAEVARSRLVRHVSCTHNAPAVESGLPRLRVVNAVRMRASFVTACGYAS
jgi:hypothetical protein